MKLFLCGGGSGEKTVLANKKFNEVINHSKPLLYVPLAMDEEKYSYDGCLEWIKEELKDVNVPYIDMVRTFTELKTKNYYDYCAIFIGGGNTFKLLKGLKESGAFVKIKEYLQEDGIVYGGSAGAIIFGKDITSCISMDNNDVGLEDTIGFNLLDGKSIFAHYTNYKNKYTLEENERLQHLYTNSLIEFSKTKGEVIGLPEEDTIIIKDDKIEVIGTRPYFVFANGTITEIEMK